MKKRFTFVIARDQEEVMKGLDLKRGLTTKQTGELDALLAMLSDDDSDEVGAGVDQDQLPELVDSDDDYVP